MLNLGLARPLFKWVQKVKGVNPVDLILGIVKAPGQEILEVFIAEFEEESRNEWFDSIEALQRFGQENVDDLVKKPFLKMSFKYTAILLLNKKIARAILDSIVAQIDDPMVGGLSDYCFERIWFIGEPIHKKISFPKGVLDCLREVHMDNTVVGNTGHFRVNKGNKKLIDFELKKNSFDTDNIAAVTMAVENYSFRFIYDVEFTYK